MQSDSTGTTKPRLLVIARQGSLRTERNNPTNGSTERRIEMTKWTEIPSPFERPVDERRNALTSRLRAAQEKRLAHEHDKAALALAAAEGDACAVKEFAKASEQVEQAKAEAAMLTNAIEELDRVRQSEQRARQEEREAKRQAQLGRQLDFWVKEQTENYLANIERCERTGQTRQAALLRGELSTLRSDLEARLGVRKTREATDAA
jgi:hypothetical protein